MSQQIDDLYGQISELHNRCNDLVQRTLRLSARIDRIEDKPKPEKLDSAERATLEADRSDLARKYSTAHVLLVQCAYALQKWRDAQQYAEQYRHMRGADAREEIAEAFHKAEQARDQALAEWRKWSAKTD